MGFDPDKYLGSKKSSGFDPDAYLENNGPSKAQTALEQFGNAASAGYLPQLQAAAEKPMFAALNKLTGEDVEADDYVTARDRNIRRLEAQVEANPKTALASQLAGSAVSAAATPIPGLGASKGLLGALGKGAAAGAVQGAVMNPGDREGEIDPLQLEERAKEAYDGAKLGALTGGLVGGASKTLRGIEKAPGALKGMSERAEGFLKPNQSGAKMADKLSEYKSQFQFPQNSKTEKYLDGLIKKTSSMSPDDMPADVQKAIKDRIGEDAFNQAEASGELTNLARAMAKDAANFMMPETAKVAGRVAKKYVGLVGANKIAENASRAAAKTGILIPQPGPAARVVEEMKSLNEKK